MSAHPSSELSGVRSSWDTVIRNSSFKRLLASASRRNCCSRSSVVVQFRSSGRDARIKVFVRAPQNVFDLAPFSLVTNHKAEHPYEQHGRADCQGDQDAAQPSESRLLASTRRGQKLQLFRAEFSNRSRKALGYHGLRASLDPVARTTTTCPATASISPRRRLRRCCCRWLSSVNPASSSTRVRAASEARVMASSPDAKIKSAMVPSSATSAEKVCWVCSTAAVETSLCRMLR